MLQVFLRRSSASYIWLRQGITELWWKCLHLQEGIRCSQADGCWKCRVLVGLHHSLYILRHPEDRLLFCAQVEGQGSKVKGHNVIDWGGRSDALVMWLSHDGHVTVMWLAVWTSLFHMRFRDRSHFVSSNGDTTCVLLSILFQYRHPCHSFWYWIQWIFVIVTL